MKIPRPSSPDAVLSDIVARIVDQPGRVRVLLDGAPPAATASWADALVDPLRSAGRTVLRVHAADWLRPASLRYEYGRDDPDAFYSHWLDLGALRRELLDPTGPGGSGSVLPRYWDAAVDRSARASYVALAADAVVLLDGPLLLGAGLPADLLVHLHLSDGALVRGVIDWTLPAYRRYAAEVDPVAVADVVVFVDHPTRPAIHP